jgi:ribosome biogenesis GTPase
MQALVYKSTGSWYVVKDQEGRFYNARIKGKLKIDDYQDKDGNIKNSICVMADEISLGPPNTVNAESVNEKAEAL